MTQELFKTEQTTEKPNMMNSLIFKCHDCSSSTLEEIRTGVIITTPFTGIEVEDDGYSELQYNFDDEQQHDGCVDRYQCSRCGFVIKDSEGETIQDKEALKDWLQAQPYNQEPIGAPV